MGVTVFEGLDDVDWKSMHHAYESAWNVPGALRAMVSKNADKRAWAWDYLWGAVHHQGDVYDCTVAAIPFLLEAAANPKAHGRGEVVKLLASIGGADREDRTSLPDGPMREHVLRAQQVVAEAYPVFLALLADAKPKVRAAAAQALLACPDRVAEAVPVMLARVAEEPKEKVRETLIETLCTIAERAEAGWLTGVDVPALQAWFATTSADDPRPDVRIAALTARFRTMPDDAGDPVPVILDLLAKTDADMRTVSEALGARVDDRLRLIRTVLREGPDHHLGLTRWAASRLLTDYRADYGDLMRTCGDLLSDPDGNRRACAIFVLARARPLAAPAADAMADYVARAVGQGRAVYDPDSSAGFMRGGAVWQLLDVLGELRDERALPYLVRALDRPDPPETLFYRLAGYGPVAAELALPLLRERLAAALRADDRELARNAMHTLIKVGAAAEAMPILEKWLPEADCRYPGIDTFWKLHSAGPAAAAVAPALRRLLSSPDAELAMQAADTLWAIEGDAEELLPVYERLLPDLSPRSFAGSLHALGPAAAPLAGHLRRMLDAADEPDWPVARALWTITGDVEATLPTLVRAWTAKRYAHAGIAECWEQLGPRAAVAEPLLRAELAEPTRATYDGSSEAIPDDEEFLVAAARALAAVTGQGDRE